MSLTKATRKVSILLSCFRQGERITKNAVCQVHRGIKSKRAISSVDEIASAAVYAAKGTLQSASKRQKKRKRGCKEK